MNKPPTTSKKHRYLDELILSGETQTTIDGPIPSFQNGLHWRAVIDATPVTIYTTGKRADGVIDGSVCARGVVHDVHMSPNQREVTLFVQPP